MGGGVTPATAIRWRHSSARPAELRPPRRRHPPRTSADRYHRRARRPGSQDRRSRTRRPGPHRPGASLEGRRRRPSTGPGGRRAPCWINCGPTAGQRCTPHPWSEVPDHLKASTPRFQGEGGTSLSHDGRGARYASPPLPLCPEHGGLLGNHRMRRLHSCGQRLVTDEGTVANCGHEHRIAPRRARPSQ